MKRTITVSKANGHKELFDPQKLMLSLVLAGAEHSVAEAIAREVESHAMENMTSNEIFSKAFEILHTAERRIAARYSVRRAIAELGPTGFPFEKFVGDIFLARGYIVLTDQMITGACAEHEVDVVAYSDTELILVEVKFHNEVGIKSDLKVALYVKARMDDLGEVPLLIGGKERMLTAGWLITNTKFTQSALNYALCKNLKLVGWNYPDEGSLEDMINEYNLYPITCLASLDHFDRVTLIGKGVVLVTDIIKNPDVLKDLNISDERIEHVMNEITILFPK